MVKHSRSFTFWEQMDSHFHVVVPVSIIAIINGFEKPGRVSFYIVNVIDFEACAKMMR